MLFILHYFMQAINNWLVKILYYLWFPVIAWTDLFLSIFVQIFAHVIQKIIFDPSEFKIITT